MIANKGFEKHHQLLSRRAAAEYLGFSVRTLIRRTKEGKITYVSDRPGARVFYRLVDLNKYIEQCLVGL